jgi:hypothetical protein
MMQANDIMYGLSTLQNPIPKTPAATAAMAKIPALIGNSADAAPVSTGGEAVEVMFVPLVRTGTWELLGRVVV